MSKGLNRYFARMHYGVEQQTYTSSDMKKFLLGVRKIIEADGLSDRERWAYGELAHHLGVPDATITKLMKTELEQVDLRELLAGFRDRIASRAMLYDAITIASVDGYTDDERKLARRGAASLGLDERVLRIIDSVVAGESALREIKATLFERS